MKDQEFSSLVEKAGNRINFIEIELNNIKQDLDFLAFEIKKLKVKLGKHLKNAK